MSRPKLAPAAVLVLAASGAAAQSVDQVVARYLEARGGIEKLRAIQSLRLTGRMSLPDAEASFVMELKRPNKMRTEFIHEGRKGVRAFDGKRAWALLPLPGEVPRPMAPDEAAEAKAQADVDLSPLVDAAAKGVRIELAGRHPLPGGETWTLVVHSEDAPPRTLFLDTRTHLVVRAEETRLVERQEMGFVTEISDYRSVGGVVFPHRVEVGPKGSPERQRISFEKVEINPPLDDARFAMPERPPASR